MPSRVRRLSRPSCTLFLALLLLCLAFPPAAAAQADRAGHDLVFLPAHTLARLIASREVTSVQVVEAFLAQIGEHNAKLTAIVTLDGQHALARAREADAALARGEVWGPLHGVPVTIKDNYATKGLRSTNSSPDRAGYVPAFDATAVARLKAAGAIILGKENLPRGAMDYQTRSPLFGVASNPWDLARTPGGSTGGGAAAVAAGLSPLSLGNDIGGSIRIPSHYCGIYGLKPTENMVSSYGVPPDTRGSKFRAVRHLNGFGPLARSIDDLELCLKVIAGPDTRDVEVPAIPLVDPPAKTLASLRVAWADELGGVPVSEDTKKALAALAAKLGEKGCSVRKASPEGFDYPKAWQTYGKIMDLELGQYQSGFTRFVSYIFGWRYRRNVPFLSLAYPATYRTYLDAMTARDGFVSKMEGFLADYDVWICPVASTTAFRHIAPDRYFGPFPLYSEPVVVDGRPLNYLAASGCYTTLFNLTGSPVVVVPIGYTREGMPIGAQLVGRRWRDLELLQAARLIDKASGAFRHPPGY